LGSAARRAEGSDVSAPHPQVLQLLERAARSPLPLYHTVPPLVARRLYRDTRSVLAPQPPEVGSVGLRVANGRVALREYRPSGMREDEALPALVYLHGGGWTIGDLDTHDVLCRQFAQGAGCAVYSVEYRLAPEDPFPAAVEDAIAATRWIAAQAETLRIDPARIAVGGDSAGGNLATVVALDARDQGGPALCFQLLIYPATDQRCGFPSHARNGEGYLLTRKSIDYFRGHYLPRAQDWTDWRASPLLAKSLEALPPAFVLTAGFDPLLDEGRAYAARLAKENVQVAYREYSDMIHGFILFGGVVETANEAVAECCARLREAFGRGAP
jgi:acetyl esterase